MANRLPMPGRQGTHIASPGDAAKLRQDFEDQILPLARQLGIWTDKDGKAAAVSADGPKNVARQYLTVIEQLLDAEVFIDWDSHDGEWDALVLGAGDLIT